MAAQGVDEAVERLVRHRLALVAAAGEHDRRAVRSAPVSRNWRTSAHFPIPEPPWTAAAMLCPRSDSSKRVLERGEVAVAADETGNSGQRAVRVGDDARAAAPQPAQDLGSRRAPGRIRSQEIRAERSRSLGIPDAIDSGGGGLPARFFEHHSACVP